jgi:hypothetical protein
MQVEIESCLGSRCNRLGYLTCNLTHLDIKGEVEAPLENKTNCHQQYKNTEHMAIILREA